MTIHTEYGAFATRAVHSGSPHDQSTGAVIPAVSSTQLLIMLNVFLGQS